jgi:thiosulfate dehydrogenase
MLKMKENTMLIPCCLLLVTLLTFVTSGFSDETAKLEDTMYAKVAKGALLYDNWPLEALVLIGKTHPSYPAEGKVKGDSTWRCKECHGWDYKGKAGAYSSGKHYTGIKGARVQVKTIDNGDNI